MLNFGDLFMINLVFFALSFVAAVALVSAQQLSNRESARLQALALYGVTGGAALATWLLQPGWCP